jgi:lipopolysaccharide transport protein LptA
MRRFVLTTLLLLLLGALGTVLVAALPPAQIKANHSHYDYDKGILIYEGNVRCQLSLHQTVITCSRLEANAMSDKAATTITATGDVVFSLISEGKTKEKPTYKLEGTAQRMLYTMKNNEPVIRLLKEKGVKPVLNMTDTASKETMKWTGSVIEYNLKTRDIDIDEVETTTEGGAQ